MKFKYSIVHIIERMLNNVDNRLIDHGKRVSYVIYRALRQSGGYQREEIQRLCLLGLLHDVGAYKTEEINNLVHFETEKVWEHSVYGYLFIKYFSPLRDLAPVLLFHHADLNELTHLQPSYRELAQIIHVADRFDILSQTSNLSADDFRTYFERNKNWKFDPAVVDMIFHPGWQTVFQDMDEDSEFHSILYQVDFTDEEVFSFITTLVLSIDFRSPQTVTHTFTSSCVSAALARLLGMDDEETLTLFNAAMLHDIGKIGIPYQIVEKTGRLDPDEMEVMKRHVTITRDILAGQVEDRVLSLAARHHERLDGTGYPEGLKSDQIALGERIIAVADVFSALGSVRSYKDAYPKEKVVEILKEMGDSGTLDAKVVGTAIEHYDFITAQAEEAGQPILESYRKMQKENLELLALVKTFEAGRGEGNFRG